MSGFECMKYTAWDDMEGCMFHVYKSTTDVLYCIVLFYYL